VDSLVSGGDGEGVGETHFLEESGDKGRGRLGDGVLLGGEEFFFDGGEFTKASDVEAWFYAVPVGCVVKLCEEHGDGGLSAEFNSWDYVAACVEGIFDREGGVDLFDAFGESVVYANDFLIGEKHTIFF